MLDDGEDMPDSFVPATPFPASIMFNPAASSTPSLESSNKTLVVVAPKLSFLFDKIEAEVVQLGTIAVKFAAPAAAASDPADAEQDETKRYFDYETEPSEHVDAGAARGAKSASTRTTTTATTGAASTIEIPVLYIAAARAAIVRLPVLEHLAANTLAQFLATEFVPAVRAATALVLAPAEMSMGLPGVALLKSALLTSAPAALDTVASLPPPHGVQGGPASALSAFEREQVPSAALVIRGEGPVGHELIDRESVFGYISVLRAAYGLNLSAKSFHESDWGMYI
ncbi:hypothetical protein D0Z00_000976 [Geotrichum galactomycetum]|uniref:Uncharacterized protein n=1 Tax=Geotrichum galactomycetum TaxID=27317 RepID=A0ACB6V8B4_9ASCO|nr:hypothetical protein D0Z00_000976 [Geotrichum candidum]